MIKYVVFMNLLNISFMSVDKIPMMASSVNKKTLNPKIVL